MCCRGRRYGILMGLFPLDAAEVEGRFVCLLLEVGVLLVGKLVLRQV